MARERIFHCNLLNLRYFLSSSSSLQPEQIQAEYKALALQYHPDKNSGDKDAEAKFQQLKVSSNKRTFTRQQERKHFTYLIKYRQPARWVPK